jgi:hypothetical protein
VDSRFVCAPAGGDVGPPVLGHHDELAAERAGEVIAEQPRGEPRSLVRAENGVTAARHDRHYRVSRRLATALRNTQPFCVIAEKRRALVLIQSAPSRTWDRPQPDDLLIARRIADESQHHVPFAQRTPRGDLRDNLAGVSVLVSLERHSAESCHRAESPAPVIHSALVNGYSRHPDRAQWAATPHRPEGLMGYTTDFIGHIEVCPPLNIAEQHYLQAFSASRRYDRTGGPYEVPGNPSAEYDESPADLERYNAVAHEQPSLWCGWRPCWDGCCIAFDGSEKFYRATQWLTYWIDHFLAPQARAADSGLACFDEFTFDHVLDGIIAACRRDTRELYLIDVERNDVRQRTLHAPDAGFTDADPLPYEIEIDGSRLRRRRPRRA